MKNNFESGHAQNMANMKELVNSALEMGDKYAPTVERLQVKGLNTLLTVAEETAQQAETQRVEYLAAAKKRAMLFEEFAAIMMRISAAMKWLDVLPHTAKHVIAAVGKMNGKRRSSVKQLTAEEKAAGVAEPRTVSVSHRGYVKRLLYGHTVLMLLEQDLNYNVMEADLQVAALRKLLADMEAAMDAVSKARAAYASVLIDRDHVLYAPKTGLVAVGKAVKQYIRSRFGLQSMEYRKVKGLTLNSHQVKGVKLEQKVVVSGQAA